jgi:hypothetical protein
MPTVKQFGGEYFDAPLNEPITLDERRRLGTSPRVRAMAARARAARRLAVKNAVAQADLFFDRAALSCGWINPSRPA